MNPMISARGTPEADARLRQQAGGHRRLGWFLLLFAASFGVFAGAFLIWPQIRPLVFRGGSEPALKMGNSARLGNAEPAAAARPALPSEPVLILAGSSPFTPHLFGEAGRFRPTIRLNGPYELFSAQAFAAGGRTIVLHGITVPGLRAVCLGGDQQLRVCGIEARAALHLHIRGKSLECSLATGNGPLPPMTSEEPVWQCRLGDEDLALWLVSAGWARPSGQADLAMQGAMAVAEEQRRGLWDGGWRIVRDLPLPSASGGQGNVPEISGSQPALRAPPRPKPDRPEAARKTPAN